jgi:tRNA threonylcarbamoyl adenosine modification protein (Sua5/YciO/YrdC/YwlC family)
MAAEFIKLYEENPQQDKIEHIADVLKNGGLIIYPTDTIYGLGCDIFNHKALDKVKRLKGIKSKSLNLSFICYDLSDISTYAKVDTPTFKLMKKTLPGPFTFLLRASSKVPKILNANKKNIGIRVPDNNIPREIVKSLGNPIITTSIHSDDVHEIATDPELILDEFGSLVDVIINGGYGAVTPSTIVDCTNTDPVVIREGKGNLEDYL